MSNYKVSKSEKCYLRELAKKQLDYARKPVMAERAELWRQHNRLEGTRPMVVMEEGTFLKEILPDYECVNPVAIMMERSLMQQIQVHELIDDDKVIPDTFEVPFKIDVTWFGHDFKRQVSESSIGYHIEPLIVQIAEDFSQLKESIFYYDQENTRAYFDVVNDTIGDILPVKTKNHINQWAFGITQHLVNLMGMENMFFAMVDEPEAFLQLVRFVTDELHRFLRWQEDNGLLKLNYGNDYMGSGSYCFFEDEKLPAAPVKSTDLWGHLNSQESVGLSPDMFRQFIFPCYEEMAREFRFIYYGCCEPVDTIWECCLSKMENLRKVSISAWCNEAFMAEQLAGGQTIYSRKPSPNFIGVEQRFDAAAFRRHIEHTARLTKKCRTEYIFRDIYTLSGNKEKLKQAVQLTRNLVTTL